MLATEAQGMINYLKTENDKLNLMRRTMLYYGYMMCYDISDTIAGNKSEVNAHRVNAWCMSNRCANPKEMNRYTVPELSAVVTQFKTVYRKFNNALAKKCQESN